jgi:hypothetical protein
MYCYAPSSGQGLYRHVRAAARPNPRHLTFLVFKKGDDPGNLQPETRNPNSGRRPIHRQFTAYPGPLNSIGVYAGVPPP